MPVIDSNHEVTRVSNATTISSWNDCIIVLDSYYNKLRKTCSY